jgi:hypothetical protein
MLLYKAQGMEFILEMIAIKGLFNMHGSFLQYLPKQMMRRKLKASPLAQEASSYTPLTPVLDWLEEGRTISRHA